MSGEQVARDANRLERDRAHGYLVLLGTLTVIYLALAFFVDDQRWLYLLTSATIGAAWWGFVRGYQGLKRYGGCGYWFFAASLVLVGLNFIIGLVTFAFGCPQEEHLLYGYGSSSMTLDRQYRYAHVTYCAEGWGNEAIIAYLQYPNNAAVNTLALLCGPPPHAYAGPYPAFAAARDRLVSEGRPAALIEDADGRLMITFDDLTLNPDFGRYKELRAELLQLIHAAAAYGVTIQPGYVVFGAVDERRSSHLWLIDLTQNKFVSIIYDPAPSGG